MKKLAMLFVVGFGLMLTGCPAETPKKPPEKKTEKKVDEKKTDEKKTEEKAPEAPKAPEKDAAK
jgi:hypothetical protein